MKNAHSLGEAAIAKKGGLRANRFLILRRSMQFLTLTLFLLGPLAGIWILKGNLSSSLLFDVIPFSDPFVLVQCLFSGHVPIAEAWIGVLSACWWTCFLLMDLPC